MLLELIAAIALGAGTAGMVLAVDRLVARRRLPGWLAPAAAGTAMVALMVYLEYSWADRLGAQLPAGVVVTTISRDRMWYRPWTYARPLGLRMVAVDTRRNRLHDEAPGQVMTTVILLGRWLPTREMPVVFDCVGARRADLHAGVQLGADGQLVGAQWRTLAADDATLTAACLGFGRP
jgi:hypothetical protein